MKRRDKRSLVLCLTIGDGCLYHISRSGKIYGGLSITHSKTQADYLAWKASLITEIVGRSPKIRPHSSETCLQFSLLWTRFKVWRKRFYPSGRKDRIRMLRFISHPELMMAVWLCDDGSSDKDGRLRLHTSAMDKGECELLVAWLIKNFGVSPKINTEIQHKTGKRYNLLQFSSEQTITIYKIVRDFMQRFKSMRKKFERTERRFQRVSIEPSTVRYGKDIVQQC